ncbi:MAG: tetratricopeptide repeat protein [Microvirga sp.]
MRLETSAGATTLEPNLVPLPNTRLFARFVPILLVSAACVAASPAAAARSLATRAPAASGFEPADSLEGNYLAAYIAGALRDTAAAASYYRETLKADPRNPEVLERAFVSFLADGAMPDAFRLADRVVGRDNANGLAHLALGAKHLKAKQYATARAHLAKGGRGRAADLTATLIAAWAYAGAGDGKKALETVDKLKGERAYAVFRDYHAGLIAETVGNQAEAEKRLKSAYEAERNTLRIVDAYARLQSRRGQKEAALQTYAAFEAVLPRHPIVRDAVEQLKSGRTLPPLVATAQEGAAEVLYGLGAAGNTQGDELPAIVYLRLALYLNPEHPLALVTLADVFERLKQLDRANEIFTRIPEQSPVRPTAEIQIGLNLEQMGKGEEAVAQLERLKQRRPDDIEVLMALGNVQRSRKKYPEAAETYSKAIERIGTPNRSHWSLFYYRGSAYERAKEWAKAEADLKKSLELVPDGLPSAKGQVLNYLAYSWVDQNINIDEAFAMLKRAVEISPRDGMVIDSLGWAHYRLGHYDEAVKELEKAIELKPGDPVINDHLGDAYWKVGRHLEARFQWQHAKDSSPEPEDLPLIVKKLEHGIEETPKAESALQKSGG